MSNAEIKNGEVDSLVIVHSRGGKECHPLKVAKWNHYASGKEAPGTTTLYFCVDAAEGTTNTDEYAASRAPWWEICVVETTLEAEAIIAGGHFDVMGST